MSDMLRITGMVSGMDTDATVKKLIEIEQKKVDKAEQQKQILTWQQEQYRELSATIKTFQTDYLNILKPSNNFMSKTAFNVFTASFESSALTVKTTGETTGSGFTIASIAQLASKDTYKSDAGVIGKLQGSEAMSPIADVLARVKGGEKTLTFNLDGVSKTITLDPASFNNYATEQDFINDLNDKLSTAYPALNVVASQTSGVLSFDIQRGGVSEAGHKLSITTIHDNLLTDLKFTKNQSNYLKMSDTLASAFGLSGDVALTINGVSNFGIKAEDTIEDMVKKINNSKAGVTLSYSEFDDTFRLESKDEGSANSINFSDTSGLFSALKLNTHDAAKDAIFSVQTEGGIVQTSRSSNTFDLEGNQVTLKATSTDPITVGIEKDTKDVKDKIIKFVDAYNKMIETINKKTTEKRYRNFAPLTAAQKKELEEEDEKNWQEKAMSGLLKGDPQLSQITSNLRRALYESVEGVGISLSDVGITTSPDYKLGGKLIIDEAKLDKALQEKPNEVADLFTKKSSHLYDDDNFKTARYKESGLAQRINDIINDNIKTIGGGGYLIKKAGSSDIVDTKSDLYEQLQEADKKIDKLMKMLANKEEQYYQQFARMEAALQKYNSQSSWLMQQFGG